MSHLCIVEYACIGQHGCERLDEFDLGERLHALADDLRDAVTRALAKQRSCHEMQQDRHKPIVGDQVDVNPRHIRANHLKAQTREFWLTRLVRRLLTVLAIAINIHR